jgi:hypothetical protein
LKKSKNKKTKKKEENKSRRVVESINLVELAIQSMTKKQAKLASTRLNLYSNHKKCKG